MPAVVAVVVTHEPGDWFEEVLGSLRDQDYPTLGVLVLDSSSGDGVVDRVTGLLPGAIVRRVDPEMGYSEKANLVTGLVEGAAFYLFCHDDVALAPDATSVMVNEAFRSNAAIVGPKTVQWADTSRLLAVGSSVDMTGSVSPFVEPGELDQEQHDRVRDVFFIPGACTLVRSDLFAELGGFDEEISYLGEDLDICWRAQVAGARVMVAPDAVVRHIEALGERRKVDDRRRLQARHRVRSLLACSGFLSLVFIVPLAIVMALVETIFSLARGRVSHARDVMGAWLWNLGRAGSLHSKRRRVAKSRKVSDFDVWRLQSKGSARLRAFTRDQIQNDQRWQQLADRSKSMADTMKGGSGRLIGALLIVVGVIYAVGSRHLISRGIPEFGDFVLIPDGLTEVLGSMSEGVNSAGTGSEGPAATGEVLLGLTQTMSLGASDLIRFVAILGAVPLGLFGMWRSLRPLGSHRASAAGVVVYGAIPFGIDAVSVGSWPLLIAYASAPFILARILRLSALVPFGPRGGLPGPGTSQRAFVYEVLALGLLIAVVAAFSPGAVLFAPLMAVGILVGCLLSGQILGGLRTLGGAIAATFVALVLNAPYLASASDDGLRALWGPNKLDQLPTLSELVRFDLLNNGSQLGWGFIAIGAIALSLGRGWRIAWAARAWAMTLVSMGAAWVIAKDLLPVEMPALPIVLLVAAPAIAFSAALLIVAVERDVTSGGFGWRQLLAPTGLVVCLVVALPIVAAAPDGRWGMPRLGLQTGIEFVESSDQGSHRVLWLGDESLLPGYSWQLSGGLDFSVSSNGQPELSSYFGLGDTSSGERFETEIDRVLTNETSRAGRALGVLGVRYIVVVIADAPVYAGGTQGDVQSAVVNALSTQLDLTLELKTPALMIFENTAWIPTRAVLPLELQAEMTRDPLSLEVVADWQQSPGLDDGQVGAGDLIYLGEQDPSQWEVRLNGVLLQASGEAFGFGSIYMAPSSGIVSFNRVSPSGARTTAIAQVALFLLLALLLVWATNRRSTLSPMASALPPSLTALAQPDAGGAVGQDLYDTDSEDTDYEDTANEEVGE